MTMPENDRREAVAIARRRRDNHPDRRHVRANRDRGRAHTSSASRSACRRTRPGGSRAPAAAPPRRRPCVPSASSPDASIGAPASCARHAPTASKFSIANPIGSITLWQLAQAGLARCSTICSRIVFVAAPFSGSLSAGTLGGGGARRRAEDVLEHPLAAMTGDVRVACDVTREHAALAEQPLARIVVERARAGTGCRRCPGSRSGARAAR